MFLPGFTLESLKTSLRKEITEEVKTLLAQSQKELIMAIRSPSLESKTCADEEVVETLVRSTVSPSKTIRFENDKNTNTMCIRNKKLYRINLKSSNCSQS